MVIFNIAGFLADFTNGRSEISVNSSHTTVAEALNELWQLHVGLRDRVVNEQGQLRTHVNIFVDGENIRRKQLLDTPISDRTEITILPSVSGGNLP
jgi:molybdopterin converting factor small subunit